MSYDNYRPSSFKLLPDVVKNLLIINGLLFLATYAFDLRFHIDLTDYLGLHYFEAEKFRPWQFITYMFMHGGFTHIALNMFALWMFGSSMENVWGPKRFLTFYIFTGLGAALTHYLVVYYQLKPVLDAISTYIDHPSAIAFKAFLDDPNLFSLGIENVQYNFHEFVGKYNELLVTDAGAAQQLSIDFMQQYKVDFLNAPVVVGASGAVFGLLLAFGMTFPNNIIYVYFAIPMKAKYFVMLYGAIELYSGISNSSDNVAHFAHLGGMLFGILMILYWRKKYRF
jgi:membrane associated rhomboid family serine protease